MVKASIVENQGESNGSQIGAGIKLPASKGNSSSGTVHADHGVSTGRRLLEEENSESKEGGSESKGSSNEDVPSANLQHEEALEADADASFELLRDNDELADEYSYDYDDYVDDSMWGDEEWTEVQHEKLEDFVNVDSHILCTPVSYHL